MATALRGRDPDRVWRAATWLAMVKELRMADALAVCVFLAEHEPDGDRGSKARARLVARLALELRIGLDHLDQLHTWVEILPDPAAIAGLSPLCDEVDRNRADTRASRTVPGQRGDR